MFHPVNGDRQGNRRLKPGAVPPVASDAPAANKGDRGFSDQAEARTFFIGTPPKERQPR